MTRKAVPVIAIDGPSASGKGTIAQLVAQRLGFHYLDSGALYRLVGLAARRAQVNTSDEMRVAQLAKDLDVRFDNGEIYLNQELVTDSLRSEEAGAAASEVAALPCSLALWIFSAAARFGRRREGYGVGRISRRQAQNLPDSRRRRARKTAL